MVDQIKKQASKWGQDIEDRFAVHHHHYGTSFAALFLGAGIGVLTALLIAPKKGEEFQQDLAEGWNRLTGQAEDFAEQAGDKIKDAASGAKQKAESAIDKTKSNLQHAADSAKEGVNDAADKANRSF